MGYLKLLITHGLLLMLEYFLSYMYAEKENFSDMANDIITSFKEEDESAYINPYYMQGLSMKLLDINTNEEVYNDIAYLPDFG